MEDELAKQRSRHPNKEIEKALVYAEEQGWRVTLLNGHAWGKIQCPWNDAECRCGTFCQVSVWSTPRVPEHMAHNIHRAVDGCKRQMALAAAKTGDRLRPKGDNYG
ncbi:MAG: hypothetical protein EXR07_00730 [Acetobacteraceae bacterium]|nr:hypothetical protein [Acetobacteraceae bacterium]